MLFSPAVFVIFYRIAKIKVENHRLRPWFSAPFDGLNSRQNLFGILSYSRKYHWYGYTLEIKKACISGVFYRDFWWARTGKTWLFGNTGKP